MNRQSVPVWYILVWVFVLTIALAVVLLPSRLYIETLVVDDALYYPIIARHLAQGLGSTYDGGITLTNGYHPLWAYLQVPIAALFGQLPPLQYLWWLKLFVSLTTISALVVWARVILSTFKDYVPVAVFTLLLGGYWWSIQTLYGGMETPLVVLLMGLCLYQAIRIREREAGHFLDALLLGIFMAACFLARLDSVFFLAALSVHLFVLLLRKRRWVQLTLVPATVILLTFPYLLWNWVLFGSILPVSGARKTIGLDLAWSWWRISSFWIDKWEKALGVFQPIGLLLMGLALLAALYVFRKEIAEAMRKWSVLWILPVAAVTHYGYTNFFMSEGHVNWYQYAEYLTLYLFVATGAYAAKLWLAERRLRWAPLASVGAVWLLILLILLAYVPQRLFNPTNVLVYEIAVWAKENLPEETIVGMYDSGVFHFVSERSTMALNGLAGDERLAELVDAGNLTAIAKEYPIEYMVGYVPSPPGTGDLTSISTDVEASSGLIYASPEVQHDRGPFRITQYLIVDLDKYLSVLREENDS